MLDMDSPEFGGDEEVCTLGISSLQGCMETVANGRLIEVVTGTVDVPAEMIRNYCPLPSEIFNDCNHHSKKKNRAVLSKRAQEDGNPGKTAVSPT